MAEGLSGNVDQIPNRIYLENDWSVTEALNAVPWFDRLVESPTDRLFPLPVSESPHTFIGVCDSAEDRERLAKEVSPQATEVKSYRLLPVLTFRASLELARDLAVRPGFVSVIPVPKGFEEMEALVEGFDQVGLFEAAQRLGPLGDPHLFAGITEAEAREGYPIVRPGDPPLLDRDPDRHLITPPALMAAINFSVGPLSPDYETKTVDPVNIATLLLSRNTLIVAAAGNSGADQARETMSAWAEMPWVLAVGGTSDPEGTELAGKSSRGIPGVPDSGPDVVAWGVSELDSNVKGTSFAAPRVTRLAVFAAAVVLQLRHCWQVISGGPVSGVQVVGAGFVDRGYKPHPDARVPIELPALPILGPNLGSIKRIAEIATESATPISVRGTPDLLRRMMIAAARPMPDHGPHEVGSGFLNDDVFVEWLISLDGRHFVEFFAAQPLRDQSDELAQLKLLDLEELKTLLRVISSSMPLWNYDYSLRTTNRIP